MPRALDVEARERAVVEAAWRVIVRDGVQALSIRNVAAEAGLAPSSMRYTFPTHTSIRERAIAGMLGRMLERVDRLPDLLTGRDRAMAALAEVLPLDAERRTESQICKALGAAALTDPSIEPLRAVLDDQVEEICRRAAAALGRTSDTDVRLLFAVVDGLALHLVHQPPEADTSWALDALADYLDRMAG